MIERVEEKDLSACTKVVRESFLTVAEEFGITPENAPRFTAFSVTSERLLSRLKARDAMFAYFDEAGEITAYVSLSRRTERECELNYLCVLPKHRHRSIGQALLQHAFCHARQLGFETMRIGIVEENQKPRRWYERYGAQHVGTQKYGFFPFTCGYLVKKL